jgi:hypothetical protein
MLWNMPNSAAASTRSERPLPSIAIIGVLFLIAFYATEVIPRETISPEICLAYLTLDGTKTLAQALGKFLAFHEIWYRPLTQYVTNYILFAIIDIHKIYLIKAVSFAVIFVNAAVATALSRRLLASSLTECILTFSLVITHPLYYSIAFEGSGISDPVFTIFLNLFIINYLTLLETSNIRLGYSIQLGVVRSGLLCTLCCLLVVGTVTSQERGLAIFPVAGVLYIYYLWPTRSSKVERPSRAATSVFLFSVILGFLYLIFVYASKGRWTGEHYRSDIEFQYILPNLVKAFELPLRLLFSRTEGSYDAHYTIVFNLFALPFIACLVGYAVHVHGSAEVQEKHGLLILGILFICSLLIPVLFGAAWWHFYTAAIYLSIATGRAVCFWFEKASKVLYQGLLIVFFAWLALSTAFGIKEQLQPGTDFFQYMSIVPYALNDRVLNNVPFVPKVVYYDTGSDGDFIWPFGGQGNLFKYLYRDPSIIEIALVHGKVLESEQHLCAASFGKRTLSFAFDADNLSWSAIAAKPCQE